MNIENIRLWGKPMVQLDPEIQLRFFEKRSAQLQNAILQIEVDKKSVEQRVKELGDTYTRACSELDQARVNIIRVRAEIDEKKNSEGIKRE